MFRRLFAGWGGEPAPSRDLLFTSALLAGTLAVPVAPPPRRTEPTRPPGLSDRGLPA